MDLAETFEKMEKTTSRIELTNYLVDILNKTSVQSIDKLIYLIQGKLGPSFESKELGVAEKIAIKSLALASGYSIKDIQIRYNQNGDIGKVAFEVLKNKLQTTLSFEKLTIDKVYDTLVKISTLEGSGSADLKLKYINGLLNNSTNLESKFILKLILGNLRLGIADFTIIDAISVSLTGEKKNRAILEHAYNLSSDLGNIARLLSKGSIDDVRFISISLFTPIRPMLAERGSDAQDALKKFGDNLCFAEYKIDGERVQVHKDGKRLQLFTRNLENITNNFSDIVEEFKDLNIRNLIVDGEIVSIDTKTKRFLPFQSLMHRKRKYKIDEAIKNYPVVLNLFDILFYDDKDKTILPYIERREILESIFNFKNEKIKLVCNSKITTAEEIDQFMEKAIEDGCEGLMLKNSKSVYRTGAREWAWIKLKKEYSSSLLDTIDLTIVGAVHGKGRRAGNYGTFLLAAYNSDEDTFYTICKVGTGFTDNMLEELTETLKLHTIRDKHPRVITGEVKIDTWFEPKLVVEIFSPEITLSPLYPASINKIKKGYGFALRFPKFTGKFRKDKNAEDSTTIHEIEKMYKKQLKSI